MRHGPFLLAMLSALLCFSTAAADFSIDPWSSLEDADLGNITSDGSGGRQIQVRPLEAEDIGHDWKFFPPHAQLPEIYPDPLPDTPAQSDILLVAGSPLVLVLPQLQHFPASASVSVSHAINGTQIAVDASIRYTGAYTNTIYGPHEYLYPLGSLAAGQYRLTLNYKNYPWSYLPTTTESTTKTGYVDFIVQSVPEPSGFMLAIASAAALFSFGRSNRPRPAR